MHKPYISLWTVLIFIPALLGCAQGQNPYDNVWNGNNGFGHPQAPVRTDL